LVLEKNAIFFTENWQKSPQIVITTSNPGSRCSSAFFYDVRRRDEDVVGDVSVASHRIASTPPPQVTTGRVN
jgi:hypothetical protein